MNNKKLPKEWALLLADLHNKVMEIQDQFDTIKSDLYSGDIDFKEYPFLKGFDSEELEEEIECICDQLDTIEAETSDLDCEYNNYECEDVEESDKETFAKAYNDYLSICSRVNGEKYEEAIKDLESDNIQVMNEDSELFDVNFGVCCFTILNENGKAFVCNDSIEVWNDKECAFLGTYTAEEIAENGGIKD